MPEFLKKAIGKSANKAGLTGRKKDQYVYGAMNNLGAMHGSKTTAKGKIMQAKHDAAPPGIKERKPETRKRGIKRG